MTTVYFADALIQRYDLDPQIQALVDGVEFTIVPIVNTDGYVYSHVTERLWRKNRRDNGDGTFGVDLNRNWSVDWGGPGSAGNTASNTYRGPTPFSEPETQAIRDFVLAHPEIRAMVEEAARHGVKVAAHAHGTEGIIAAVRAGVASIEHGSMLNDEAIALMKEKGTYLVPTTYLAGAINLDVLPPPIRAKAEAVLPVAKESVRRAIQAGVKIAFGTDAAVFPHGDNAKEFAALVERGLTPLEAIRSATLNAVDLLGVDDRGLIAPGRWADIIAVPGNPLEDVRALEDVRFVMKGGKVFKRP